MEKPRDRSRERRVAESDVLQVHAAAEGLEDSPAEKPADRPAGRQREPNQKVTYTLPVRLKRLIDSVASDLGIDPCELVARLLTPALKGCSRPTIPLELRRRLGQETESAA